MSAKGPRVRRVTPEGRIEMDPYSVIETEEARRHLASLEAMAQMKPETVPDKVSDADRERARAWMERLPVGYYWMCAGCTCVLCRDGLIAQFATVRAEQREADARIVDAIAAQRTPDATGRRAEVEAILGETIAKVAAAIRAGGAP